MAAPGDRVPRVLGASGVVPLSTTSVAATVIVPTSLQCAAPANKRSVFVTDAPVRSQSKPQATESEGQGCRDLRSQHCVISGVSYTAFVRSDYISNDDVK